MQPANVEHALPGRIRLRFPAHRHDVVFFEQLVNLVSQHPAVIEAVANPLTGSLLVRHTASLDELGEAAVRMGMLTEQALAELKAAEPSSGRTWKALLKRVPANLPLIFFLGLSATRVLRGQVAGPASEQFWHAFAMWRRQMPLVSLGLALLGLIQIKRGKVLGSASSLYVYGLTFGRGQGQFPY